MLVYTINQYGRGTSSGQISSGDKQAVSQIRACLAIETNSEWTGASLVAAGMEGACARHVLSHGDTCHSPTCPRQNAMEHASV